MLLCSSNITLIILNIKVCIFLLIICLGPNNLRQVKLSLYNYLMTRLEYVAFTRKIFRVNRLRSCVNLRGPNEKPQSNQIQCFFFRKKWTSA